MIENKITITEIDKRFQRIDTQITDPREVLRILVTTVGSFVVELTKQNPDKEKELTKAVHSTLDKIIKSGLTANPIKEVN